MGQTENYYEQLNELGEQLRDEYLLAMRDMARNPLLLEEYAAEEVLLRIPRDGGHDSMLMADSVPA